MIVALATLVFVLTVTAVVAVIAYLRYEPRSMGSLGRGMVRVSGFLWFWIFVATAVIGVLADYSNR